MLHALPVSLADTTEPRLVCTTFMGAALPRCRTENRTGDFMSEPQKIDALLEELRVIDPPEEFREGAVVQSPDIYQKAEDDFEGFWEEQAERLHWSRRWTRVLEWKPPWVKWFIGGRLNVSVNCLDRHLETIPDRVAYHWEGEPGDERRITYRELHEEVCGFANALRRLGVRRGDVVAIYMGMIPELPVAMLACARIGAPHSVVFGGFAADAPLRRKPVAAR